MSETSEAPVTVKRRLQPLDIGDCSIAPAADSADHPWQGINADYLKAKLLNDFINYLFYISCALVPMGLKIFRVAPDMSWWWVAPWPIAVTVFFLIYVSCEPRRVRAYAYREDPDHFLVRRGLLFRRLAVIPYGRMQYVDIKSGPILRFFGLAELVFRTASTESDAKLPGIDFEEADRLRRHLTGRGERRMIRL